MSGTSLTSSLAELLALDSQQQQAALSTLKEYKSEVATPPGHDRRVIQAPPGMPQHAPQPCMTAFDWQMPMKVDSVFAKGRAPNKCPSHYASLDNISRRSSVASTWAPSTVGSMDVSDAASEASSPLSFARTDVLNFGGQTTEVRSTLKLSNIPRRCGKEELLDAIELVGFVGLFDFFYLPLGPQSKKNHGYAFINFKDNETADRFTQVFSNYRLREKNVEVVPAPLQGLAQNMEHFSKTQATKTGWAPSVVLKA
mmetsp:Transcript_2540/g.6510  ORF Transcript_2540/g.6510 Transcript_2540/m.6510 type:complete len:255 (-) Transcript_2540:773-1537(-)